jgi:hypothetical protein
MRERFGEDWATAVAPRVNNAFQRPADPPLAAEWAIRRQEAYLAVMRDAIDGPPAPTLTPTGDRRHDAVVTFVAEAHDALARLDAATTALDQLGGPVVDNEAASSLFRIEETLTRDLQRLTELHEQAQPATPEIGRSR